MTFLPPAHGADAWTNLELLLPGVDEMAVNPVTGDLFAGVDGDVYEQKKGSTEWKRLGDPAKLSPISSIGKLIYSDSLKTLYATDNRNVYRLRFNETNPQWARINTSALGELYDLCFDEARKALYVSTLGGIYRSELEQPFVKINSVLATSMELDSTNNLLYLNRSPSTLSNVSLNSSAVSSQITNATPRSLGTNQFATISLLHLPTSKILFSLVELSRYSSYEVQMMLNPEVANSQWTKLPKTGLPNTVIAYDITVNDGADTLYLSTSQGYYAIKTPFNGTWQKLPAATQTISYSDGLETFYDKVGKVLYASVKGKTLHRYSVTAAKWDPVSDAIFPQASVQDILVHPETNHIYVATYDGVFKYADGKWTEVKKEAGTSLYPYNVIYVPENKSVYVSAIDDIYVLGPNDINFKVVGSFESGEGGFHFSVIHDPKTNSLYTRDYPGNLYRYNLEGGNTRWVNITKDLTNADPLWGAKVSRLGYHGGWQAPIVGTQFNGLFRMKDDRSGWILIKQGGMDHVQLVTENLAGDGVYYYYNYAYAIRESDAQGKDIGGSGSLVGVNSLLKWALNREDEVMYTFSDTIAPVGQEKVVAVPLKTKRADGTNLYGPVENLSAANGFFAKRVSSLFYDEASRKLYAGTERGLFVRDISPRAPADAVVEEVKTQCGNNIVEGNEYCDGSALGKITTCRSFSAHYTGGTLSCAPDCVRLIPDKCTSCGNGIIEEGEECESVVDDINGNCVDCKIEAPEDPLPEPSVEDEFGAGSGSDWDGTDRSNQNFSADGGGCSLNRGRSASNGIIAGSLLLPFLIFIRRRWVRAN